ncbi:hypothetical protein BSKO_12465 [Bryopsis sp. KO-2023]|nr:hypothetical protein BSKO_12465 [Bryopsis sp. KO-2023]
MFRFLWPLRLLTLLATLPVGYCQLDCTGGPVAIPASANFQQFVLPLEEGQESSLPTITSAQALSNLGVDFLQQETIQELAGISDSFFQVAFSALSPVSSSVCNIPISVACRIQACGCPAQSTGRRRLLQCFPFWGCSASGVGESFSPRFPNTLVGLCISGTCTLFKITFLSLEDFESSLDRICPGISAGTFTLSPPSSLPPPPAPSLPPPLPVTSPPPPRARLQVESLFSDLRQPGAGRNNGQQSTPRPGIGVARQSPLRPLGPVFGPAGGQPFRARPVIGTELPRGQVFSVASPNDTPLSPPPPPPGGGLRGRARSFSRRG